MMYTPVRVAGRAPSPSRRLGRAAGVWTVWVGGVTGAVVLGMRGAEPAEVVAAVPWFVVLLAVAMLPATERR